MQNQVEIITHYINVEAITDEKGKTLSFDTPAGPHSAESVSSSAHVTKKIKYSFSLPVQVGPSSKEKEKIIEIENEEEEEEEEDLNDGGDDIEQTEESEAEQTEFTETTDDENEPVPTQQNPIGGIFKQNKHGNPDASKIEAALSEIARLHMGFGFTPPAHLVKRSNGETVGLISDAMGYVINDAVSQGIYTIDKQGNPLQLIRRNGVNLPEYKFLDQIPDKAFFANLIAKRDAREIEIDMESLSSILGASYTLEEDDLHKGNIGFYIIHSKNTRKPRYVFFKIDHDLMLADSVMSYVDGRLPNMFYNKNSFRVTRRDTRHFPDLKFSKNHYWPTRSSIFKDILTKLGSKLAKKMYAAKDRQAFKNLKRDEEFKRYKWKQWLRDIAMPPALDEIALQLHLDPRKAYDAEKTTLIRQALVERMAKLRATLLAEVEFRKYLIQYGEQDIEAISEDLKRYMGSINLSQKQQDTLAQEFVEIANNYKIMVEDVQGAEMYPDSTKDTPLHMAILANNYRFEHTHKAFKRYWNQKDRAGLTPLDLAVDKLEQLTKAQIDESIKNSNPSNDPVAVVRNLIRYGATNGKYKFNPRKCKLADGQVIDLFKDYYYCSPYLQKNINNYDQLKVTLIEINNEVNYTLNFKKQIALQVVRKNISHLNLPDLQQFKKDLNGNSADPRPGEPRFHYIVQLRSNLWLVRIFYGLYGNSKTKQNINKEIDRQIRAKSAKFNLPENFSRLFTGPLPDISVKATVQPTIASPVKQASGNK